MLKANEYAKLSTETGAIANRVRPEQSSPVTHSSDVAVYHLRCAARELRKIAEWAAEKERTAEKGESASAAQA